MSKRVDVPALIFTTFSVLYPLIAVTLLRTFGAMAAFALVMVLLAGRLLLPVLRKVPLSLTVALIPVLIAMAAVSLFDVALSVRLYPVFMNAVLLVTFAISLMRPPTVAERFARAMEPDLPEAGVRYTRTVTEVWVAFFTLNGAIALWTVLQPGWDAWLIYNGAIAYAAAGLLFAGEYLVRLSVKRRGAR
ncbi:hypothetical protein [Rhizomicrobium electricum]|uniref:Intracellular septation protein A n=1 Tax=Rhizomicrobium electricum TaxID=480070 RepID=A0ABN1ERL7_9PROT|nr:hypothetical protein [Rhizomicrobium electricum]NIJ49011.1 putative membrane protein [Rhizomicrobium electricum]